MHDPRVPSPSIPRPTFPLYDHRFETDSCGTGFVAHVSGIPSRQVMNHGLEALARLEHRGAIAADGKSGDGSGVLTGIPRKLYTRDTGTFRRPLQPDENFAVGVLFIEADDDSAAPTLEQIVSTHGLEVVGWRDVPVMPAQLGDFAQKTMPLIRHVLIAPGATGKFEDFEHTLYIARKAFERTSPRAYVCSLSSRHVVYKALCAPHQLPRFYPDLADPDYESAFALYHQRFSTNTLPSWELAQPFRLLAHNGEINTLWGNRAWMTSRQHELPEALHPVLGEGGSDSADLDAALELLARNGRDVLHAISMLIVPAWDNSFSRLHPDVAAFYRYHASLMEPWDGPAALVFADDRYVGAALDRNGLRPCRYKVTRDGFVVAGSEVGVVDLDPEEVIERGRLGPGQIMAVDLHEHRVLDDAEIKRRLGDQQPYAAWVASRPLPQTEKVNPDRGIMPPEQLARNQQLYGFSREAISIVLTPMATNATRANWSMGDDTPIPPLARAARSLYTFFRQRFAQVTNPAIDPLRESCVMSLTTWLGPRPNLLTDGPQPSVLELETPVIGLDDLATIKNQNAFRVATIPCIFPAQSDALASALEVVTSGAVEAVRKGASILLLTDEPVSPLEAPIPMALAVGAVHRDLVRAGLRTRVGLVVQAGDCFDVHHVAVLLGYGASAVCPWMALTSARALAGEDGEIRTTEALAAGLRKIMSKMGISTVTSYRGAQLFDILGLAPHVVERCFNGTVNPVGGLGFSEIAGAIVERHHDWITHSDESRLPDRGLIRFRRNGEHHAWSPQTVRALQRAVGSQRRPQQESPTVEDWVAFLASTKTDFPVDVRDLLALVPAGHPIPLDEVESVDEIVRRFVTSAMSLGALSPEAHQTLTRGMNRLGARSNTGEGGEDSNGYEKRTDGDDLNNKIKQIASGRFGVTAQYLAQAEEIEIKVAQGSKPGEGGQLPGHKVTELIARLRHSQPGVPLISPPPHHDIYSIEDLAQLIHDLKRCNPRARIGVKLVAEAGVGTIAAGVAKAYADYVVISGHSGGTGASALSSIKHAGSPWELGLAETQQVLRRNDLRRRVRVRVDGGFQTASDVLIAAALGAEEFGFGTAPLIAIGCDMARQCHKNTCPTGIATQKDKLRAKFRGKPEHIVRYFRALAEDLRQGLASLGLRTFDELVGRTDLLRQTSSAADIDLSAMLVEPHDGARHSTGDRNDRPETEPSLDDDLTVRALAHAAAGTSLTCRVPIRNRDRSVGARIAGALAARFGLAHPPAEIDLQFTGSAGQSFGAFATPGMTLTLIGESNDYVGKGLSGGTLILQASGTASRATHEHVIMGNVALYGATAGKLFAAGRTGERFAVRNSGAIAVVEGTGDHCCEYMTGGAVIVLGETGANFGAGMTGGTAYVLDESGSFPERVNPGHVGWARCPEDDLREVHALIVEHERRTRSSRARDLLANWSAMAERFWKVAPIMAPESPVPTRALQTSSGTAVTRDAPAPPESRGL